ncbi:MAG TPA: hypothetical protein VKP02_08370 [Gemmatimonadaceae bacterium]|nr:hypothetical protein [Gemmatimonadaceae bacterium]
MRRLVIFYEDHRGPLQRFPLHDLVVKSAADLVQLELYELFRRVVAVPKNGVSKVLDEVGRCHRFLGSGERLLVWVDNDDIRRALQLAPRCARGMVISTIKARAPDAGDKSRPKPLEVFLLDDNLEDLLSSIGAQLDQVLLTKALAKKLDARDILLDEIGRSPQLRAALRANHTGFDCVSRFVGCVAAMEPWPVPP